jgi:hypothetical protein
VVSGRGHRPGRGRDARFCTEIIGLPAEHLEPMKAMPMWPLTEAGAATLVHNAAVMDGCQDGTGLPARGGR